jgi:hypothetical protein
VPFPPSTGSGGTANACRPSASATITKLIRRRPISALFLLTPSLLLGRAADSSLGQVRTYIV